MPDKFELIKQKYLSSFAQKQRDIESAWDEKDLSRLNDLLHKLAGSSGSYGYMEIYKLCHQANDMIYNKTTSIDLELDNLIQKILQQLKDQG